MGERLIRYDSIAVNTIVKNKEEKISSCDILYNADIKKFNEQYLRFTAQVAESCQDRDLSEDCMVIGTSAVTETEIDGAVGMNGGIFNNPFLIWGRYRKKWLRYTSDRLFPVSSYADGRRSRGNFSGKSAERNQKSQITEGGEGTYESQKNGKKRRDPAGGG